MNPYVNSICCIDRQMKFTKGMIPLLGSALNEPTVKRLESMVDDCRGPTADIQNKKMALISCIMRHMNALCNHVTLPSYTKVQVKMVPKISCSIYTEYKNCL